VTLTLTDLKIVNSKVNMLPYKSDPERFGMLEWWADIDESGGDCDDYAIAKYHRLRSMGMPAGQMRFATCFVERSAAAEKKDRYHCVLLVDMNGQTYVLDNRHSLPLEYDMLPYEFHKLQIAGTREFEWAQGADRSFG